MAKLLFILGPSCTGKSTLAEKIINYQIKNNQTCSLLDKDTIGDTFARAMMKLLNIDEYDRDSPDYKKYIRDLEYKTCLDVIADQVKNNINVICPGPWTKEILSGDIFDPYLIGLPANTLINYVYLTLDEQTIYDRIIQRNHPRDKWKLENWNEFVKTLKIPSAIIDKNIKIINTKETIITDQLINSLLN